MASEAGAGPTQARAVQTRRVILEAAAERFAVHGYRATSLDELLSVVGLSKGALYFHFPSKEALARTVIEEMVESWPRFDADLIATLDDPLGAFLDHLHWLLDQVLENPIARGGTRLLSDPALTVSGSGEHYRLGERNSLAYLEHARSRGQLRDGVAPVAVAQHVSAVFAGHRQICDALGDRSLMGERVRDSWRLLLPAVASDAWLAAHPHRLDRSVDQRDRSTPDGSSGAGSQGRAPS